MPRHRVRRRPLVAGCEVPVSFGSIRLQVNRSFVVVAAALLAACQGEKAGDPCDQFFQNTCKRR
jgi:hypothetical protein